VSTNFPAMASRSTAEERREDVLAAAEVEFSVGGLQGTSTEAIARRAGISQPYLFRLFPSKKAVFLAAVERTFARVTAVFGQVSKGLAGEPAREAMGQAYDRLLREDPAVLRMQLHAYAAAADDDEVRGTVRRAYDRLWDAVVARTGMDDVEARTFFAHGMLCNVAAALDLGLDSAEPLADRLLGPKSPALASP